MEEVSERHRLSFEYVHKLLSEYRPYCDVSSIKSKSPLTILHYDYCLHYILSRYNLTSLVSPFSILELGCGYGFFVDFLTKLGYSEAVGIDIRKKAIRYARKFCINVELVDAFKLTERFETDSLDLILAINFFHRGLETRFNDVETLRQWVLTIMRQAYDALKQQGDFFCTSEISLDFAAIKKIGFKLKYNIEKCSFYSGYKQVLVFEK